MWRSRALRASLLTLAATLAVATGLTAAPATAAGELTVAQALAAQDGRTASVIGYIVGQPVAQNSVIVTNFTADTALALADTPTETATGRMLYVQITSAFRATFGLLSNPARMRQRITVSGQLTAYFAHAGLKNPTSMQLAGTPTSPSPTPSPTPSGPGSPSGDYYADATGKTGTALRTALHTIIRTQTKLSYSEVWEALKDTDQDPGNANNVVLLYSGRSQSKSSNGGGANDWNREHVWAKSHGDFGTATGPGTDVHHLRPEDVTVNSARGNKDFDAGGSSVSEAPGCRTDADSWEPRDAVKGDVARMMMYMAIRYEGGDGWPDLELNDAVNNGTAPRLGRLTVLLQWHQADPPDAFERRRNDVIYTTWQHNRNPFIDHPEWASAIWN
jgi:endonuclease I